MKLFITIYTLICVNKILQDHNGADVEYSGMGLSLSSVAHNQRSCQHSGQHNGHFKPGVEGSIAFATFQYSLPIASLQHYSHIWMDSYRSHDQGHTTLLHYYILFYRSFQ